MIVGCRRPARRKLGEELRQAKMPGSEFQICLEIQNPSIELKTAIYSRVWILRFSEPETKDSLQPAQCRK